MAPMLPVRLLVGGLVVATAVLGVRPTAAEPPVVAASPVATASPTVPVGAPAGAGGANYSPSSRTLAPTAVHSTTGSVTAPGNVLTGGDTRIAGRGSSLVLDFGREVGGFVTLSFRAVSDAGQRVGLAYSESSLYVGPASDASNGGSGPDGATVLAAPADGSATPPPAALRGGFRYLTVFLDSDGWVDLHRVSLAYTPAPTMPDPSAYPNYFHSDDELLNRIWYAGAHTVQTNTIAPAQGRTWPAPAAGWDNAVPVGVGETLLVDGAKRDRTVWPGDLGIAVPTAFVSTNDMLSTRNALQTVYDVQRESGELPFAGPVVSFYGSDTYHLWTLAVTATYYRYTADRAWLDAVWPRYSAAWRYILAKVGPGGLLSVTGSADWARSGQGGENLAANAILYSALLGAAELAEVRGESAADFRARATAVADAVDARLWDPAVSMYRDNPTSTLHPQDGNALAVWFGLTRTAAQATAVAGNLAARWNRFGATTPEKGGEIATFPGSMEVHAHFAAGDDARGLELIRRQWGYMLDSPVGTGSTFWEGFRADGSFDYGGSYMSLAHGWATGPTSALTFSVLGIAPTSPTDVRFVPHPGDLTSVAGRITLPGGPVDASWTRDVAAGTITATLSRPPGTTATVGVPKLGGGAVAVQLDGATVWADGVFVAGRGAGSGWQDDTHIHLSGLPAGSITVRATGVGVPAELPEGFTPCAAEGGTCAVPGTRAVAYGAGTHRYRVVAGDVACTSAAFGGDPAPGVAKSCSVAPAGGPVGWTACADEGGTCRVDGATRVAYGGAGAFATAVAASDVACGNGTFGDPVLGVPKRCFLPGPGGPDGRWTPCAAEGGSCSTRPGQPVAFGARGVFAHTPATGSSTACDPATFGDPLPGVVKGCHVRVGGPAAAVSRCASEGETCAFTGTRAVAFGADGAFVHRTRTGGAPCTATALGADPLYGAVKSCWLLP